MRRVALIFAAGAALAACQEEQSSLADQPKMEAWETASVWADDAAARPWPVGVVPRNDPLPVLAMEPPEVTDDLLASGRERFEIFCTPCHGYTGTGDGRVVQRGFPPPPSFLSARLRLAPPEHFVSVITEGYGVMFPYADRVAPRDRWAITAYIRALQAVSPEIAPSRPGRVLRPLEAADG